MYCRGYIPTATVTPGTVTATLSTLPATATGNFSGQICNVSNAYQNIDTATWCRARKTTAQWQFPPTVNATMNASVNAKEKEAALAYHLYIDKQFPALPAAEADSLATALEIPDAVDTDPLQTAVAALPPRAAFKTSTSYVRRLKNQFPALSVAEAAIASGASATHIRKMSEFLPMTIAAKAARAAVPRQCPESRIAYARRLKIMFPALSIKEAAVAAGANVSNLWGKPEFRTRTAVSRSAVEGLSVRGSDESRYAYVLRLKREFPHLSVKDASLASDLPINIIRDMPGFTLPPAGAHTDHVAAPPNLK